LRQVPILSYTSPVRVLQSVEEVAPPFEAIADQVPLESATPEVPTPWRQLADWGVNLGLAGVAVALG
jgi:hypothetical protein